MIGFLDAPLFALSLQNSIWFCRFVSWMLFMLLHSCQGGSIRESQESVWLAKAMAVPLATAAPCHCVFTRAVRSSRFVTECQWTYCNCSLLRDTHIIEYINKYKKLYIYIWCAELSIYCQDVSSSVLALPEVLEEWFPLVGLYIARSRCCSQLFAIFAIHKSLHYVRSAFLCVVPFQYKQLTALQHSKWLCDGDGKR